MATVILGYVGCGFMAQKVHIPNLLSLEGCELRAVAEVRPQLARAVAERHRIPVVHRDHRALAADPAIQAVVVSGDFSGQGDIAADLLRAGKDVLVEKPLAISSVQAERILAAERASGRRAMVAYMKRYDAGNLAVKALVDGFRASGELGAVRYARNHGYCGDWTAGLDTPFVQTDEPYPPSAPAWPDWLPEAQRWKYVGYLQQFTHNINLLRFLLGADAEVAVRSVHLDGEGRGVVVLAIGGVTTVIESGSLPYHGWEEHTQIYFDKGWVRTEAPPLLLRNQPATVECYRGDADAKQLTTTFPAGGRAWSYREEVRHFVECVASGAPFRSPASDAARDVAALEAIWKEVLRQAPAAVKA